MYNTYKSTDKGVSERKASEENGDESARKSSASVTHRASTQSSDQWPGPRTE